MADSSIQPPEAPPEAPPARGEPEWWRRTFAQMSGMGLSEEERRARKAERDCKKCNDNVKYLKRFSPIVIFLLQNIRDAGGNMDQSTIQCLPCDDMQAGGFSPKYGVLLCQNHLRDRGHTEDTLAHELVHAYDHLRFQVDWMNLRHHACTEIRASSLSGECRWTREAFTRGVWDFTKQHQACVRRRATLSVARHPKCENDAHAARVVNEVWDSCFADTRPFNEIYR